MHKFSLYSIFKKNIRQKPLRHAFYLFATVSIVAIITSEAALNAGFDEYIDKIKIRSGADIIVAPKGFAKEAAEILLEPTMHELYMNRDVLGRISVLQGVKAVSAHTYLSTKLLDCCDSPFDMIVVAIDQDTDFIIAPWLRESLKRKLQANEFIVGTKAEEYYSISDFSITVLLNRPFNFAGVMDKIGIGLDYTLFIEDDAFPYILENTDLGFSSDDISLVFVKIRHGYSVNEVADTISENIHEIDTITRDNIEQTLDATLSDILQLASKVVAMIALVGITVNWRFFSIMMKENRGEITALRLPGAWKTNALKPVLFECMILGTFVAIAGTLVGMIVVMNVPLGVLILDEVIRTMSTSSIVRSALIGLTWGLLIPLMGIPFAVWYVFRAAPRDALKDS